MCTKFEALSLHEARETDGGTKNVKSVLGGIFCILQCLLALYLCVFLGFRKSFPTDIECTGSARRICTLLIWRLSAVVFVVFASNFWQPGRRLLSFDRRPFYCSYQIRSHLVGDKERRPRFDPRARLNQPPFKWAVSRPASKREGKIHLNMDL
jgi:hypothetical protein